MYLEAVGVETETQLVPFDTTKLQKFGSAETVGFIISMCFCALGILATGNDSFCRR